MPTNRKRQFTGGTKPRTFFDRKVRSEGHTRSLSLGKVIPKNWAYVRIKVLRKKSDMVEVRITKMLDVNKVV
jgi:hypothetical protein